MEVLREPVNILRAAMSKKKDASDRSDSECSPEKDKLDNIIGRSASQDDQEMT